MEKFHGKGVYGAVAIGRLYIFKKKEVQVKCRKIEDADAELERLEAAKCKATEQLRGIYDKALREVGEANAQIFEIHMMIIDDEDYNEAIVKMIQGQGVNAEYAVAITADNFAEMFSSMDDSYMQARAADVCDISNRIIACMNNSKSLYSRSDEKIILCAGDLAPSETVSLDKDKVLRLRNRLRLVKFPYCHSCEEYEYSRDYRAWGNFISRIHDGDLAIADGFSGTFIVNPDEETLSVYRQMQHEEEEKKKLLQELKGKENITLDGRKINIFANIGSVDNIGAVLLNDAGGIGLFHSEFLYLESSGYPTEDAQFKVHRRVLESMAPKKVIIRTLDIGADKQASYFHLEKEENPALGLRAIRLCLSRPDVFKTQLRALYRASVYGKLGIMFPMITSVAELEEILSLCSQVKDELAADDIDFSDNVELGIMIETPAAAVISDRLAPMVDFFSVGTNDLTQYTLACDRQNPNLERFCDIHHEAILRLIEFSAKNAHENGAWIGICGELAADTSLTEAFLRMGIDELSVSPAFVLRVRDAVRKINLS